MLKTRTYRWWRACLICSILNLSSIHAQNLSSQISDFMNHLVTEHEFSGSVIVTKNGKTIHSKGYGWANREHQIPNTPDTKFRIGSITKQFTAMAIFILYERGKLELDSPISTYIPNLPRKWSEITIDQLLTHTSGIMHSWLLPGFTETMMQPATLAETIDRFKNRPLLFTPGESFAYSDVGYFILAQIIEQVTGETYEDFLRRSIFNPLGMNDTGADNYRQILSHRATGYTRNQAGYLENAAHIYMPILTGGGNLYSTVKDLARWDQALTKQKLISEISYQKMYTPVKRNYAYGWFLEEGFGHQKIRHNGNVPGFRSFIIRYPKPQVCIVILKNAPRSHLSDHNHTSAELEAIIFGKSLQNH